VTRLRQLGSIYARIGRTYRSWAPSLLVLATIVFVPVGLLDALTFHADLESLDINHGLELAAVIAASAAITITALLGEVFYAGAVAVSLTHPEHGHAPPLREIAGRLNYHRLIAIDLIYGLIVTVGLALLIAPGIAAFVWLGLAGPIVEIEDRGVRAAFARSYRLIRHRFWTVLLVLGPIELAGDAIVSLLASGVHGLLGDTLFATWLADTAGNILFTPFFAIAAVLLTLDLIAEKDGAGPVLNPSPTPIPSSAPASA
jgi:hypothetical protein